jgi:hypothetical protein
MAPVQASKQALETKTDVGESAVAAAPEMLGIRHGWRRLEADGKGTNMKRTVRSRAALPRMNIAATLLLQYYDYHCERHPPGER